MKLRWLDHINGEWAEVPTQASTDVELFDRLLANQEIVVTPSQILYTKVCAVCELSYCTVIHASRQTVIYVEKVQISVLS